MIKHNYRFTMRAAIRRSGGGQLIDWDSALPIIVYAPTQAEAQGKACALLRPLDCSDHWDFRYDQIEEIPSTPLASYHHPTKD